MIREDACACADTDNQFASCDRYRFLKRLDELLAGHLDVLDATRAFIDDGEFVAAQTSCESERAC